MNPTILNIAQEWISQGYSIIPITYHSKRPAFDALRLTGNVGGEVSWSPYKERLATAAELKTWFLGPKRNLGIVTGYNNLVALDFDDRDVYAAWMTWAYNEGGIAADIAAKSYRVMSSRGVHVYVTIDETVVSYRVEGVDVKARFGYVVTCPSTHPSGYIYQSDGGTILHCQTLEQIFPFSKPEPVANNAAVITSDPWEAATMAVESGGMGSIERIKAHLRIEDLLGVNCKSKRFMMICPVHQDKNPSMQVDTIKQTAYCYGCGFHGDVIGLFGAIHKISNREAIAQLAGRE